MYALKQWFSFVSKDYVAMLSIAFGSDGRSGLKLRIFFQVLKLCHGEKR